MCISDIFPAALSMSNQTGSNAFPFLKNFFFFFVSASMSVVCPSQFLSLGLFVLDVLKNSSDFKWLAKRFGQSWRKS